MDSDRNAPSPSLDPLAYPFAIPDHSFLNVGHRFEPLEVVRGRRLGQASVIWTPGAEPRARFPREKLNNTLLNLNAASIDGRAPVLAYGSNASPEQLARKFQSRGAESTIPVVRAELVGADIAYTAHIASYGSVPATIVDSPGSRVSVSVVFVDPDQLAILDETESVYDRVVFSSASYPLTLENEEVLATYYAYVSHKGALRFADGHIRRLSKIAARVADLSDAGQADALLRALTLAQAQMDVDGFIASIRAGTADVARLNERLGARHDEIEYAAGMSAVDHEAGRISYGALEPLPVDHPDGGLDSLVVAATSAPDVERLRPRGDFIAALNPADRAALDLKTLVEVMSIESASRSARSTVARVVTHDSIVQGRVCLDQVVRNAIGVDLGERVQLSSVHSKHRSFADVLLGRRYVVLRLQTADGILIERPACFVAQVALDVLGVESGDRVVLEAAGTGSTNARRVQKVALRAYSTPDSVTERRRGLEVVSETARFPACDQMLGVSPDFPWIYLDADARHRLGNLQKCSAVRVRAARDYQVIKAFREYALVVAIAGFGLISFLHNDSARFIALIAILLLTTVLVFSRVRSRLA